MGSNIDDRARGRLWAVFFERGNSVAVGDSRTKVIESSAFCFNFLPLLRKSADGRIVSMSSGVGSLGEMLSKLAKELAAEGIKVDSSILV